MEFLLGEAGFHRVQAKCAAENAASLRVMEKLGMPMTPADLGVSDQDAKDAYTGSREIRDKYLSCSMLWDMGLSEEARAHVHAN